MLLIISGPSGVGKTTVYESLIKRPNLNMKKIITCTTRSVRPGEVNGVNYYFLTIEEFEIKLNNGDFIEHANVYGNYYGSTYDEINRIIALGKIPMYEVDHQGVKFLKEKLKSKYNVVTLIIMPPSVKELKNRLKLRNTETDETFKRRVEGSLLQIEEKNIYDYEVVNDDVEKCVDRIVEIICSN